MVDLISERQEFCRDKLRKLRRRISEDVPALRDVEDLCIYVTGSFGRLEASKNSDLDVFFVHRGREQADGLQYTTKAKVDVDLMRLADDLGFPPFSGGGEYLQVHYLEDILRVLGSPKDDYENYFTARLLLLLESQPLYNGELYNEVIGDVIDSYFRDFPDHEEEFRPLFLINDIIRFWRTLCLNYEYKRNPEREESEDRPSAKDHRKNLKLKYSRLLTCFSAVLTLAARDFRVEPDDVLEMTQEVPLERIRNLNVSGETNEIRQSVLRNYAWFLETLSGTKREQIDWLENDENRARAFDKAREFGGLVYELLCHVADDSETMRYLVI